MSPQSPSEIDIMLLSAYMCLPKTCARVFTAAIFIIAENWDQPCLSVVEDVNELGS